MHYSVKRDAFSGFYFNEFIYVYCFWMYCFGLPVTYHGSCLRAYIQQGFNISLCIPYRTVLKSLTYGVKEHYGYSFRIFADTKCTDGSNSHQHEFVEKISLTELFESFPQYRPACDEVGDRIPYQCTTRQGEPTEMIHSHSRSQHYKTDNDG